MAFFHLPGKPIYLSNMSPMGTGVSSKTRVGGSGCEQDGNWCVFVLQRSRARNADSELGNPPVRSACVLFGREPNKNYRELHLAKENVWSRMQNCSEPKK